MALPTSTPGSRSVSSARDSFDGIDYAFHGIQTVGGAGGVDVALEVGLFAGELVGADAEALEEGRVEQAGEEEHKQPEGERAGHQAQAGCGRGADAGDEGGGGQGGDGGEEPVDGDAGVDVGVGGAGSYNGVRAALGQDQFVDAEDVVGGEGEQEEGAEGGQVAEGAGGEDKVEAPQ